MTDAINKESSAMVTFKQTVNSDYVKAQLKKVLPKHMTPERYARIVLNAAIRVPRLMECSSASIVQCMLDLSSLGLEPDGRHAHLIPFKRNFKDAKNNWQSEMICTLMIDYKGYVRLMHESEFISSMSANVVYEKDAFQYALGTSPFLNHVPAEGDRGDKIRYAYSIVYMKDGNPNFHVISFEEIEKARKRSKTYDKKTDKNNGPWATDYDEMAKKTALHRHQKWLPTTARLKKAQEIEIDSVYDPNLKDPSLEMGLPREIGQVEKPDDSQPPFEATNVQDEKVTKGHVETLKKLAKSVNISDDQLVELAMDEGCKNGLEELTLGGYGKICEHLMSLEEKKPTAKKA